MPLGKEIVDACGNDGADVLDILDFRARFRPRGGGPGGIAKRGKIGEVAGESLGAALPDMADSEREDQTVERHLAAGVDRLEQLLHRCRAEPVAVFQLLQAAGIALGEREDIGRRGDQAVVIELLDLFVAQPFDVEGVARREMLEALDRLRRADQAAGAAPHDIRLARLFVDLA